MESLRRPLLTAAKSALVKPAYQPVAPFLYPFLAQQNRSASLLASLSNTKGSYSKVIRRGRGPSSGKGKTSGRGHKGQGQHGKVPYGFTGGQTPDIVVSGRRGYDNPFSVEMSPVNLDSIQAWIDKGRLDPGQTITMKELSRSRCIHGVKRHGVKLLARGKGELKSKINIIVSRASAEAIAAIEAQGGTVTTRFYSEFAVKKVLKGEMDPVHSLQSQITEPAPEEVEHPNYSPYRYRLPDPISRKALEYYRDPAHRGYLSHTVKEGQGPSLYFKNPFTIRQPRPAGSRKRKDTGDTKAPRKAEAKMW